MANVDPTGLIGGVVGAVIAAGKDVLRDVLFLESKGIEVQVNYLDDLCPMIDRILRSGNLTPEDLQMVRVFQVHLEKISDGAMENLGHEACLIVLDGARDGNLPVDPSVFLRRNSKSRVVITSWNRDNILTTSGRVERATMSVYLGTLDWDSSYKLFCQQAFQQDKAPPSLQEVASKLARMCGGVPLALEVAGKAMRHHRDPKKWWNEVDRVAQWGTDSHARTRGLFRLSYDQLTWEHKLCFLAVAVLRHSEEDFLFYTWKALGLLEHPHEAQKALEKLTDASLVDGIIYFRLPATILPLALEAARQDKVPYTRRPCALSSSELADIEINNLDDEMMQDMSKLKVLRISCISSSCWINTARHCKGVRVLDMEISEGMTFEALSENLVFLRLRSTEKVFLPPDFGAALLNLEVLELDGELQGDLRFVSLPKVSVLKIRVVFRQGIFPGLLVSECRELRELRATQYSLNEEAVEALGSLVNLETLQLDFCDWPALVNLSFVGNLRRLVTLELRSFPHQVVAESGTCISKCTDLVQLAIRGMDLCDVTDVQLLLLPLNKLQRVKLRLDWRRNPHGIAGMVTGQQITECGRSSSHQVALQFLDLKLPLQTLLITVPFPNLSSLHLDGCGIMLSLGESLDYMPRLKHLVLNNFATERISESFLGGATFERLVRLALNNFPSLVELHIPSAPLLQYFAIGCCDNLELMEFDLLNSLKILRVNDCNRITQLPASIAGPGSILKNLTVCGKHRQEFGQGNMPRLKLLVLDNFATERISESFLGGATFGRLVHLQLNNFPSLVELHVPSAPLLQSFAIRHCNMQGLEEPCAWMHSVN